MLARAFIAFVQKEIFHIVRDLRTLVILFGIPVVLVFLFGYAVTNDFEGAPIAIVDQSKDDLSGQLAQHLIASGHFGLVENVATVEQLNPLFEGAAIKLALVIPPEFQASFFSDKSASVQLIADASEPNFATNMTSYASRMIMSFQQQFATSNAKVPPYTIQITNRLIYNPALISAYNFIPGVAALILMLISAMMTSLTIAREKETGTMDLLLVSPLPPVLIILGKVTPYAVLAFIDALLVFGIGHFVFNVPILGSLPLLLATTLLYLLVALALGIFISTKSSTQQGAMMSSLFVLLMPTMLLSGFIFPTASMPLPLQFVSKIIPAKYFIKIEQAIMLKDAGWSSIETSVLILTIMLIVLLAISTKNFKVRYE